MSKHLPDFLAGLGALLAVAGLWTIHPAAALLGAGALLVALGVTLHREPRRRVRGREAETDRTDV